MLEHEISTFKSRNPKCLSLLNLHHLWIQLNATRHCAKKFSIKYFVSKCDQVRSFLQIWSHLLQKPLMENLIFCAVQFRRVEVPSLGHHMEYPRLSHPSHELERTISHLNLTIQNH